MFLLFRNYFDGFATFLKKMHRKREYLNPSPQSSYLPLSNSCCTLGLTSSNMHTTTDLLKHITMLSQSHTVNLQWQTITHR